MKAVDLWFKQDCGREGLAWYANGTVNESCRCPGYTDDPKQKYPIHCELEACFNGLGVTMIILKTFYWYQLHPSLGPLAISVRKVLNDIFMISIAYIVFYVAFTFGIGLMMHENRQLLTPVQSPESPCNNTEEDGGYNAFGSWFASKDTTEKNDGVFKTSFWIMFSPGEPDLLGDAAADAKNTR